MSVLSIDDRPTVETEADKAKNDLLDLIESQRSGRILTGTIQGVEQSADSPLPLRQWSRPRTIVDEIRMRYLITC